MEAATRYEAISVGIEWIAVVVGLDRKSDE